MNSDLLEKVVNAVLYEGYILYPYRLDSNKNARQRFTFGRVYPRAYSENQRGAEPWMMQTECLLQREKGPAELKVSVRFLQPVLREIGCPSAPLQPVNLEEEPALQLVPEFKLDDQVHRSWMEAVERQVGPVRLPLEEQGPRELTLPFRFDEARAFEPIYDKSGQKAALYVRSQRALQGSLQIQVAALDENVVKITARIFNCTPFPGLEGDEGNAFTLSTFASTHTILQVSGAGFLSLTDPPPLYAQTAAQCKNIGTWPVLIGDETMGECDAMLSSPIILYDYPKIAPESPGDLFDATEIDELLSLRIQTLADEEKVQMGQIDERARRLLERTERINPEELLKLHGTMRKPFPIPSPSAREDDRFHPGDMVRIRPRGRADVLDMALAGKTAVIESVEHDAEGITHLALVLEDDPGKDLGFMRQPGHRFFYRTDEVEKLEERL